MVEFWTGIGNASPRDIADTAARAENDGWDGMVLYDSQCIFGEAFVMMTAAAIATDRLQLSLSTSNPVLRHPAVAASAVATIQDLAGNRIRFGVGRGDSSLAHVGAAPASTKMFERYVTAVRHYLRGDAVAFDDITEWQLTDDVSTLRLAHAPEASRLGWLAPDMEPAPVDVYATGPRVLGVAGRTADGVVLSVGADVARITWAREVARAAREAAGLDADSLDVTAICVLGVSDDIPRARRSVDNVVASMARFAVMSGTVVGPVTEAQQAVYDAVGRSYDMNRHGESGSQVNALTDEFIDNFAIVGAPERCVERLAELVDAGVTSFLLGTPQGDADAADVRDSYRGLVEEVLPMARARFGAPKPSSVRPATPAAAPISVAQTEKVGALPAENHGV